MSIATLLRMPVPLPREAHAKAAQFAAEQATTAKGKQVYLNTLAVYAVHTYLNWLEISTDLTQSDCWQPGLRAIFDIADLAIPEVGLLECRPVLPGDAAFAVPISATDRIGYVAVQFQEDLNTVELLGFVRAAADQLVQSAEQAIAPTEIQLQDLLPLDALLNLLHPEAAINDLRQWLEGQFSEKWRSVEELVPSRFRNSRSGSRSAMGSNSPEQEPRYAEASSVTRATAIQLTQSGQSGQSGQLEQTVVLVVQVLSVVAAENSLNVCLKLYPDQASTCLPSQLKVAALDESGTVILESQPKEESVWTELELLDCRPGERFSVRISIGESSVIEEFCV